MLAKITREIAAMQAIGQRACQGAAGTSCKTCQAENLISFALRCPPESATRNKIRARAPTKNPEIPITAEPVMRSARGIRSHVVAAQSANALHILIEQ